MVGKSPRRALDLRPFGQGGPPTGPCPPRSLPCRAQGPGKHKSGGPPNMPAGTGGVQQMCHRNFPTLPRHKGVGPGGAWKEKPPPRPVSPPPKTFVPLPGIICVSPPLPPPGNSLPARGETEKKKLGRGPHSNPVVFFSLRPVPPETGQGPPFLMMWAGTGFYSPGPPF